MAGKSNIVLDSSEVIDLGSYAEANYPLEERKIKTGVERLKLLDPEFGKAVNEIEKFYLDEADSILNEIMEGVKRLIKVRWVCMNCREEFATKKDHPVCLEIRKNKDGKDVDLGFRKLEPSISELLRAMKLIAGENRLNLGLPTSIVGKKNLDITKDMSEEELDKRIDALTKRLKDRGLVVIPAMQEIANSSTFNQGED